MKEVLYLYVNHFESDYSATYDWVLSIKEDQVVKIAYTVNQLKSSFVIEIEMCKNSFL